MGRTIISREILLIFTLCFSSSLMGSCKESLFTFLTQTRKTVERKNASATELLFYEVKQIAENDYFKNIIAGLHPEISKEFNRKFKGRFKAKLKKNVIHYQFGRRSMTFEVVEFKKNQYLVNGELWKDPVYQSDEKRVQSFIIFLINIVSLEERSISRSVLNGTWYLSLALQGMCMSIDLFDEDKTDLSKSMFDCALLNPIFFLTLFLLTYTG